MYIYIYIYVYVYIYNIYIYIFMWDRNHPGICCQHIETTNQKPDWYPSFTACYSGDIIIIKIIMIIIINIIVIIVMIVIIIIIVSSSSCSSSSSSSSSSSLLVQHPIVVAEGSVSCFSRFNPDFQTLVCRVKPCSKQLNPRLILIDPHSCWQAFHFVNRLLFVANYIINIITLWYSSMPIFCL